MKRLLFVTAAIGFSVPAFAVGDSMEVSATVSDNCVISIGDLAFGAYDAVSGAAVPGSATLDVACTAGAIAEITLDGGLNPGSGLLRQMDSGSALLGYRLYWDSSRLFEWGGTGFGLDYAPSTSAVANLFVYGTIQAGEDVPEGDYFDTVVATISF